MGWPTSHMKEIILLYRISNASEISPEWAIPLRWASPPHMNRSLKTDRRAYHLTEDILMPKKSRYFPTRNKWHTIAVDNMQFVLLASNSKRMSG